MKKLYYLIIIILISSLVLVGCTLINITTPTVEQSGVNYLSRQSSNEDGEVCIGFEETDNYWPESGPLSPGDSVEELGAVHPLLNIDLSNSDNNLVLIKRNEITSIYDYAYDANTSSPNDTKNGCLNGDYGIGCINGSPKINDTISFEFPEGVTISYFSITMLDYGDWIHVGANPLTLKIIPFDCDSNPISGSAIEQTFYKSNIYDACGGNEGKKRYEINGSGINKIQIEFINGVDRGVGFDDICFTVEPLEVPIDIKPNSCPNPLNTKSKGVTPVAILGTVDFDVTEIDPSTITLAGVSPISLSWNLEDVATPFEPYTGKDNCDLHCNTLGPDGFLDLTLKFDTPELLEAVRVINAMGIIENFEISEEDIIAFENGEEELVTTDGIPLEDGLCLPVTLNGTLYNGFSIVGEDIVRILQKGNNK
jgi:hypothetical protein